MTRQQWTVLVTWFHKNHQNFPANVSDAIETLIDQRQAEEDDEGEEEGEDANG